MITMDELLRLEPAAAGAGEREPAPAIPEREAGAVSDDALALYLSEIARVPLLTAEEERELARTIAQGRAAAEALERGEFVEPEEELRRRAAAGLEARDKMAAANLRLVVSVALRYRNRGLPLPDLVQEGNLGLLRAIDKFEVERGFKFSTYAYWWIRQAVTRAIADDARTIRLPVHVHEDLSKIQGAIARLEQVLGRPARLAEVAEASGIPEERVRELLRAAAVPASLDAPVSDDEELSLGDLVADTDGEEGEQAADQTFRRRAVAEALATLPPRQRAVLMLRYGLDGHQPHTLAETGAALGVTRERARQLEAEAISRLRHPSLARKLAPHLD